MRPVAVTGLERFAVVTVANHYRCILCVSLCCDCMMSSSWAGAIRGRQLLRVSFASLDPICEKMRTKRNLVFCRARWTLQYNKKFNESLQIKWIKTYSKHLLTKSTNSGSLHRSTCANGFVPGFRLRFFEFVMHRGFPLESKNRRRRDAWFNTSSGGTFSTSIMHANCSTSFSPGNIG